METIWVLELENKLKTSNEKVIDVRTTDEFKKTSVKGFINIPTEVVMNHLDLFNDETVYLICNSGNRSAMVYHELALQGIKNIVNVDGGMQAWIKENLPVIGTPSKHIPIMRQVMIVAGLMILTGIAIHFLINPNGIFLSAFVGAGLFYAGCSGNCYMTKLLALLPWNK